MRLDRVKAISAGQQSDALRKFKVSKVVESFISTKADGAAEVVDRRAGYLDKKGGSKGGRKNWTKRWFVLRQNKLIYYKRPNESKPRGDIDLSGATVEEVPDGKQPHTFKVCRFSMYGFQTP